jgi:hypothetical protein
VSRAKSAILAVALLALSVTLAWGAVTGVLGGPTPVTDESAAEPLDVDPGAALAGVVDVQGASLDRSVRVVAFERELAEADARGRATAIDGALDRAERAIGDLETRVATLRDAYEGDGYGTRVAPVAAKARTLRALLDRAEEAAQTVPTAELRDAGVTTGRFEALASQLDGIVAADPGTLGTDDVDKEFYDRLLATVETYNEGVENYDLGVLGTYLRGERVNLRLAKTGGGTEFLSFRTTGEGRILDLRAGPHPDATVRVTLEESTARKILDADDRAGVASQAFFDGEIKVDGLGPYNALKWTIANAVLGIARVLVAIVGWLFALLP